MSPSVGQDAKRLGKALEEANGCDLYALPTGWSCENHGPSCRSIDGNLWLKRGKKDNTP